MSSKLANYIALLLLFILAVTFWLSASSLNGSGIINTTLGPGFYPGLLAIILFILCVISLIQTIIKKDNTRIYFPNLKLILITILIVGLFFSSWYFLGYFYIQLGLFMLFLLTAYRFEKIKKKILLMNAVISIVFSITIYVIFDMFLNINF